MMTEQIIQVDRVEQLINLFGSFDENSRLLEREYGVTLVCRDAELKICGEGEGVLHCKAAVQALLQLAARGEQINQQSVNYVISLVRDGQEDKIAQMGKDVICVTTKGRPVKAKTVGQQRYVDAIQNSIVTLGIGPAGTGKTYLAVACAVAAFREKTSLDKYLLQAYLADELAEHRAAKAQRKRRRRAAMERAFRRRVESKLEILAYIAQTLETARAALDDGVDEPGEQALSLHREELDSLIEAVRAKETQVRARSIRRYETALRILRANPSAKARAELGEAMASLRKFLER